MTRARILADYVSSGDELADKAPLASPDFTGTVDLTGTTVSLDDDEISLNKVSGGTLGAGTIGGSSVINTSGAITTTGAFTSVGIDDNADALAMTVFPSKNVAIGVATDPDTGESGARRTLQINSLNAYSYLVLTNSTTGSSVQSQGTSLLTCGNNFSILNREPGDIVLATDGTDRMIIDSGGRAVMGNASGGVSNNCMLRVRSDSDSNDIFELRNNSNNTRFVVNGAGDVTVNTGDIIFGTAGKGVVLGATSNTDANTLDDYEEGTWTPVVDGSTSVSGQSYSSQAGSYTKIGNMVHAQAWIACSAKGTISGNLRISGLPFTVSPSNQSAIAFSYITGWTLGSSHQLTGWVYTGDIAYLYAGSGSTNAFQITTNHLAAAFTCAMQCTYTTNQ